MISVQPSTSTLAAIPLGAASATETGDAVQAQDAQTRMLAAADGLSLLFALQCSQCSGQSEDQEGAIQDKAKQIQENIQAAREAAERAREAAEDKGFWDDVCSVLDTIATIATVVAGAASIAVSGGLSTVMVVGLAGALLASNADTIAEVTGAGDDLAKALRYVGTAASLGAGGAGAFGVAVETTASTAAAEVAKVVRNIALAVDAGATVGKGYGTYRSGSADGDRIDAEANGMTARAQQRATQRQIGDLVEQLKEMQKSFGRSKQSLLDAQQSRSDSQSVAINIGRFA